MGYSEQQFKRKADSRAPGVSALRETVKTHSCASALRNADDIKRDYQVWSEIHDSGMYSRQKLTWFKVRHC